MASLTDMIEKTALAILSTSVQCPTLTMPIGGCCPSVGSPNHLANTSTPQTHILTQPIALLSIPPNPSLVVAVPCSGALEARERERERVPI